LIALNNLADGYKSLDIAEKLTKHAIENANRNGNDLEIPKKLWYLQLYEANMQLYEAKKRDYKANNR